MPENNVPNDSVDVEMTGSGTIISWVVATVLLVAAIIGIPILVNMLF